MLTNEINNPHYKSFIDKFGSTIESLYPELNKVDIRLIDDSSPNRTPYLIGDEDESPFLSFCEKNHQGVVYIDVICINNLAGNLHEDVFHALVAHELGHFVCHYRNLKLDSQEEEISADDVAVNLGFKGALKSGLEYSKKCLEDSIKK